MQIFVSFPYFLQEQQSYCRTYGGKSPADNYSFNVRYERLTVALSKYFSLQGEELRSKADMIDDTVLLSMFKEQEGEGGRGGRSHSHQTQSNNWQTELNGFHLQNSTSFSEYHHHQHHHQHHH